MTSTTDRSSADLLPQAAHKPSAEHAQADAVPAMQNSDPEALIHAFLRGVGLPPAALPQGLTPEVMEMIGMMLATSVQGTIGLNALRALVKREVNADVTMVVVRNNNPLKFFQDGETVLTQMFRKKMPGFMGPVEAMQDAYEDLHAHQLGVVAGVRAAMADVLRRFNPERVERRVKAGGFLDSLIPSRRKARLWDTYIGLFKKVNVEAQDDFQMLFGPAFLQAYEKEIERFKNKPQNG